MAVSTTYCTQTHMERLLSAAGVEAFSDHDGERAVDTDVVGDCIDQATEEINLFALQWHEASDLASSTLITRWCTVLACLYLCERRGNAPPASLASEGERILANLERIGTRDLRLPAVPDREDMRPSCSNLEIDRRFRHRRVRVQSDSTTEPASLLPRNEAQEWPYG